MLMEWGRGTTLQSAAAATGNGTALTVNNRGAVNITLSGTFSGTVTFESSGDGTTWESVPALKRSTGVWATTATTVGSYYIALPGINWVRARVSAYTSGNITAIGTPVELLAPPGDALAAPLPSGAATAAKQDTGNTSLASIDSKLTNPLPVSMSSDIEIGAVEIKNGTDDTRAVVGVGTAIAEADNALAVKDPVMGVTTGAGVTTDANGTIQQYLRGIIKLLVAGALSLVKLEDAAHTSGDVGVQILGKRTDTAACSAGTDGDYATINQDANGALYVNTSTGMGTSIISSTAYEASHVLKASAGVLFSLVGYNSKGAAQFIQIYNSATVPADTAVPVYTFTVGASSNFSLDLAATGIPFTTGISVANSSTGPTKTLASSDCWFTAVIR